MDLLIALAMSLSGDFGWPAVCSLAATTGLLRASFESTGKAGGASSVNKRGTGQLDSLNTSFLQSASFSSEVLSAPFFRYPGLVPPTSVTFESYNTGCCCVQSISLFFASFNSCSSFSSGCLVFLASFSFKSRDGSTFVFLLKSSGSEVYFCFLSFQPWAVYVPMAPSISLGSEISAASVPFPGGVRAEPLVLLWKGQWGTYRWMSPETSLAFSFLWNTGLSGLNCPLVTSGGFL